jgi:hypothetical protein
MNIIKKRLIEATEKLNMDVARITTRIFMQAKTKVENSNEYKSFAFGLKDSVEPEADDCLGGYYALVDDAFTEVLNSISNGDKPNFADIPVNEIVTEFVEGINSYFDTLIGKESTKYIYKETKDLTEEQQDKVNQLVAHTIKGTNLVTKNQVNSKITNALKDVFNQVVKAGTDGAESKYDELSSESDLIEF